MWFMVIAAFMHGHQLAGYGERAATWEFRTRSECLSAAAQRAAILNAMGAHGRYMCMAPGMPDDELARQPKGDF